MTQPSRPKFLSALLMAGVLFVGLSSPFTRAAPGGKTTLQSLAWLTGEWVTQPQGGSCTEVWMPPDGGTMVGMSRTVAQGRTVGYEFLIIRQDEAGDVFYVAKPSRQPEASFKLVSATATEALFENPKHDFPQRISYVLKPDGTLLAAIEGEKNGQARRVEFQFQKKP